MARLLDKMRQNNPDITYLEDCINPKQFDNLMEVIRNLSGFSYITGECSTPSVAPRLCSSLKSCSDIVKASVLKDSGILSPEKNKVCKIMDEFLQLMKTDWSAEVSTNADKTRKKRVVSKIDVLPHNDDIVTVCTGIRKGYDEKKEKLMIFPTKKIFEDLNKDLIAHIIILSRRPVSYTHLDVYKRQTKSLIALLSLYNVFIT